MTSPNHIALPIDPETASISTLEAHLNAKAQKHPTDIDNLSLNVPEQVSALEQGQKAQPGTLPFDPETASLSTLEAHLNAMVQKHSTDKK